MHEEYGLLVNLSVSLVVALVLGLATHRIGLSPISGYLLAGIALGPQTPGFVADSKMAAQFAEIGVILLMFGVGLHFNLKDLLAVRGIAIPGAIGQILAATALGIVVALAAGWSAGTGLVIGIAISVASTVVLIRLLMDNRLLETNQGHIAVGWLIVEDIFTVLVLVLLPGMAGLLGGEAAGGSNVLMSLGLAVVKIVALVALVLIAGRKLIPWLLRHVARSRSRELFTLTVLALALAIATGSAVVFGVSMALGAFLAGMVVGQSEVSHQAAADALPMRDAFAVLFFVSVGMLFDPRVVVEQSGLLLSLLGIILIAKPLAAFLIVWTLKYSIRTALTVAVALAQIGEFSFILAQLGAKHELVPVEGQSLLVTCALISITINPFLFLAIDPIENRLRGRVRLWRFLGRRSEARGLAVNLEVATRLSEELAPTEKKPRAIVAGYGPVGQTASRILREFHIEPVVIDLNPDTIRSLTAAGQPAIYGDATHRDVLDAAGLAEAKYLLVTTPDLSTRTSVILTAKNLNPDLRIFARARYLQEKGLLSRVGATEVCVEEGETAAGLAALLLREVGAGEDRILAEARRIQAELRRDRQPGPVL